MLRYAQLLAAICLFVSINSTCHADLILFKHTSTTTDWTGVTDGGIGHELSVFVDNGGTGFLDQHWIFTDIISIQFETGNYSATFSSDLVGEFRTDALGEISLSIFVQGLQGVDGLGGGIDAVLRQSGGLYDLQGTDSSLDLDNEVRPWFVTFEHTGWSVQAAGVPEPGSIGLFGVLAGFAVTRRRR